MPGAAAQDALTAQLFPRGLPTTGFVVRGTATLAEQFLDSAALERLIPAPARARQAGSVTTVISAANSARVEHASAAR
jgi:hypothetical protein